MLMTSYICSPPAKTYCVQFKCITSGLSHKLLLFRSSLNLILLYDNFNELCL